MPTAVKLQSEYGDAIQVILVHSQEASEAESIAFALRQRWLGNRAIWTSERPFSTGSGGLPSYALLGPDGRVVSVGSSANDHSKIQKLIAEMVKKGSSAPEGTPAALAKAYKWMDQGEFAKAAIEARKTFEKAQGKDAAVAEAATKLQTAISEKVGREAARVRTLASGAQWLAATELHESLAKGVKGEPPLEDAVRDLGSLFEGPEVQQETTAEQELLRLAAAAYAAGKDEKAVKKLRKFATEHASDKLGERAEKLAGLAEAALKVQQ